MNETETIEKLFAKLDLYENCLSQLKKEVPIYFQKRSEFQQHYHKLAKVIKSLASSEPNQQLQNALFFCCHQYEKMEKKQSTAPDGGEEVLKILEDSKSLIALPFRELLGDTQSQLQNQRIPARNKDHVDGLLPLHASLFEEHRLKSIKSLVTKMLTSEIRAHCSAIEDLSSALEVICELDHPRGENP